MKSILVGIDGSERGEKALQWAAKRAERDAASLALVTVVDPRFVDEAGLDGDDVLHAVSCRLEETASAARAAHFGVSISADVLSGGIVERLADAADAHDIVVLGSHHGSRLGETIGGAKGLRVSVNSHVPTVVVPADWDCTAAGEGIVVGVGPGASSDAAVAYGAREACATGMTLHLVSAWGLPAFLARPAEAMGGGLAPVGEQFEARLARYAATVRERYPDVEVTTSAIEGASPTRVLCDCNEACALLVLGTRPASLLGRALFGSVPHSVLQNLRVPTVVVPQS